MQKPSLLTFSTLPLILMAARPKTLLVGVTPVLVGVAFALGQVQSIHFSAAFLTLLCALSIQIGINLINDALDFKKGADNEQRIGPIRITQAGLMSYRQVLGIGFIFFSFAFLCGIPLIILAGWPLFWALVFSLFFGYLYTGGPYPLAYFGLGELFVFLFFGLVITCSAFYVQTLMLNSTIVLAATQMGLLSVIPIAINNARDLVTDKKAKKNTLAVRFGITFARFEITIFSLLPFIITCFWAFLEKKIFLLLPLLIFPLALQIVVQIWQQTPSAYYNFLLAQSAKQQLLFGVLLSLSHFFYL